MSKRRKVFLLLIFINICIGALGSRIPGGNIVLLFLMPFCILISLIIYLVISAKESHKNYKNGDTQQRKRIKTKSAIILVSTLVILSAVWAAICFKAGYKIASADKHAGWNYFPKGNNPKITLKPLDSLYIYNIEPIPGTAYYFIFFAADSAEFHDDYSGSSSYMGVIDKKGHFKITYKKDVNVYLDKDHFIVTEKDPVLPQKCDVYTLPDFNLKTAMVHALPLPQETFYSFSINAPGNYREIKAKYRAKYQNPVITSLQGIRNIPRMEDYPPGKDDDSSYMVRSYMLYKDQQGMLYGYQKDGKTQDMDVLKPGNTSYKIKPSAFLVKSEGPNISYPDSAIVRHNKLHAGYDIGNSSMSGGRGFYFEFRQEWLIYCTAKIGKETNSFKLAGTKKDDPFNSFYQLNQVRTSKDTLFFVSGDRIWKMYLK